MTNYTKSVACSSSGGSTTQNVTQGDTISMTWTGVAGTTDFTVSDTNCFAGASSGVVPPSGNPSRTIVSFTSGSYSATLTGEDAKGTTVSGTISGSITQANANPIELGGWVNNAIFNAPYYSSHGAGAATTGSGGSFTVSGLPSGVSTTLSRTSQTDSGGGSQEITEGSHSVNGGSYTESNVSVSNGDVIRCRVFSPTAYNRYAKYRWRLGTTAYDPLRIRTELITAPVISSVTNNDADSINVTATVNLSSSGSGGTLQYAQSTTTSIPGGGWQTSASFTHPRGTTRYYWASRALASPGGVSDGPVSLAVGYKGLGDTSLTIGSYTNPIGFGSTSNLSIPYSNGGVFGQYRIRSNNPASGAWLDTRNGASGSFILEYNSSGGSYSELPPANTTWSYFFEGRREASAGGDPNGAFQSCTPSSITVTRSAQDITPNQFSIGADVTGVATSSSSFSSFVIAGINSTVTVTASGSASVSTSSGSGYTSSITRSNGQTVYVRIIASAVTNTTVTGTVTIGSVSDSKNVTTAADITPSPFSFTPASNVALNTLTASGFVQINNMDSYCPVSVSNGEVYIASPQPPASAGWYSSSSPLGVPAMAAFSSIRARHTSSSSFNTSVTTTVTVGTEYADFVSTTLVQNAPIVNETQVFNETTLSNLFSHSISLTDVGQGSTLEYNIVKSSIRAGAPSTTIPTTGWQTSSTFTLERGYRYYFWARRGSLSDRSNIAQFAPYADSDLWTNTTLTPSNRNVTSASSGATFTVSGGTSVTQYRLQWMATFPDPNIVVGGPITGNGNITIPNTSSKWPGANEVLEVYLWARQPYANGGNNSFAFSDGGPVTVTNTDSSAVTQFDLGGPFTSVGVSTLVVSSTITIAGLDASESVNYSFTNNSYAKVKKNSGSFSPSGGTVTNGNTLQVQITASSSNTTTRSTVLSVGTPAVTDTFSVTTAAAGGGTGNPGDPTSGQYGLELYNAGGTLTFGQSNRTQNFVTNGTVSVPASGSTSLIAVSGFTVSNSDVFNVLLRGNSGYFSDPFFNIVRQSGGFKISNNTNTVLSASYWVIRYG